MQKMNKAQMLSFLFYLIIALIFFIPTVSIASKFFKLTDKSAASYSNLVNSIASIQENDINSVILHMKPESMIVGFSKKSDKAEAVKYPATGLGIIFDYASQAYVERPSSCQKDKSCICLCKKGVSLANNRISCPEIMVCSQFENINFFDRRPVGEVPFSHTKEKALKTEWKNGFFLINSKNPGILRGIYANVNTIQPGYAIKSPLSVYVKRYKTHVNVCLNRDCITNEMIDRLNKEDAIKEFNKFKELYYSCAIKENQICGTFELSLPERYYIYYGNLNSRLLGINIPFTGKPAFILINTQDTSQSNINKNINNLIVKDNSEKEIYFEGSLWKSQGSGYDESVLPSQLKMANANKNIILE